MDKRTELVFAQSKRISALEKEIERLSTLEFMGSGAVQTAWARQVPTFLMLPGLRSYYPMYAAQYSGSAWQLTDFAEGPGTTNLNPSAATPTIVSLNDVAGRNTVPASYFNGTTQYWTAPDAANFNVIGNESYIDSSIRGLTVGAWIRPHTTLQDGGIVGKWNATTTKRQYNLHMTSTGLPRFEISWNGAGGGVQNDTHDVETVLGQWSFVVGRFDPSTQIGVFHNGTWQKNTTSIHSALYVSDWAFELGRYYDTSSNIRYLSAYQAHSFLCASVLSDDIVNYIWQTTRGLYGV